MSTLESSIKTICIDDAQADASVRQSSMDHEFTLLHDITWHDLVSNPTQIGFLLIAFCTEGEVTFSVGAREQTMQKGDLLISFGDQVFQESTAATNFHAKAVLMSRGFAQNCITGLNRMWPYLLYLLQHPVVTLTPEEQTWIMECYHLIHRRLNRQTGRYMREATVSLVRAFYFEICNLLDTREPLNTGGAQTRAYAIFDQFIHLVSEHFKHERSVEWYSSEMCVTPKHLSEVVKQVSGRTAGQWITTMVIIEIKQLLLSTSLSIKEIAQEMGFPNQSFLGKYFKNIEGISPSDFRKN